MRQSRRSSDLGSLEDAQSRIRSLTAANGTLSHDVDTLKKMKHEREEAERDLREALNTQCPGGGKEVLLAFRAVLDGFGGVSRCFSWIFVGFQGDGGRVEALSGSNRLRKAELKTVQRRLEERELQVKQFEGKLSELLAQLSDEKKVGRPSDVKRPETGRVTLLQQDLMAILEVDHMIFDRYDVFLAV